MSEKIISFRRGSSKTRGPIVVTVALSANSATFTDELSLLEREVIKYELADQVAIVLRQRGDINRGHRTAIYAHLVALMQRQGAQETADFIATLAGMLGCETRHIANEAPSEDANVDPIDWSDVGLS